MRGGLRNDEHAWELVQTTAAPAAHPTSLVSPRALASYWTARMEQLAAAEEKKLGRADGADSRMMQLATAAEGQGCVPAELAPEMPFLDSHVPPRLPLRLSQLPNNLVRLLELRVS